MDASELEARAVKYGELWVLELNLATPLGSGTDGAVWSSSANTAIKALYREKSYFNGRDAYVRLAEFGITKQIDGFWIPGIIDYSDKLLVIEMDMPVNPPYILDFAKVRIDRPPEFPVETQREHEAQCKE
ncbi:MAG: hypothetical protein IT424_03120 [Pirellulales bacterium]|nr:hypothetical protein [Pirellulales bacterium]